MSQTVLEALVRDQTATTLTGSFRIAIETIGEEIAKDVLNDPAFREALLTMVRQNAKQIVERMTTRPPDAPPRRARKR
jgi:hypothetical protein